MPGHFTRSNGGFIKKAENTLGISPSQGNAPSKLTAFFRRGGFFLLLVCILLKWLRVEYILIY